METDLRNLCSNRPSPPSDQITGSPRKLTGKEKRNTNKWWVAIMSNMKKYMGYAFFSFHVYIHGTTIEKNVRFNNQCDRVIRNDPLKSCEII